MTPEEIAEKHFDQFEGDWVGAQQDALKCCAAAIREALQQAHTQVNHCTPDECPLWYDGCNCGEAFMYWKERTEQAERERDEEARCGAGWHQQLDALRAERGELLEALAWCGGAADFGPGGKAECGWDLVVRPILAKYSR